MRGRKHPLSCRVPGTGRHCSNAVLTLSRTLRVSVPRAPLCSGRSCSQGAATTVRGGPVGGHGRRAGLWPEESDGSTGLGRL